MTSRRAAKAHRPRPIAARPAALVITALLVAFIAFLVQALLRGIDLRCGCFGGDEPASWWTVARDVLMLAAAIAVARFTGVVHSQPGFSTAHLPRGR